MKVSNIRNNGLLRVCNNEVGLSGIDLIGQGTTWKTRHEWEKNLKMDVKTVLWEF
jgi:hypothetical protein